MLFKGMMVTALSGKMDGVVAAHNRGGYYFRSLGIVDDPDTELQEQCRTAMANLWHIWTVDMTPELRQLWYDYALSHPVSNRLGQPRVIAGWPAFVRQNFVMEQCNVKFSQTNAENHHPNFSANPLTFAPYPVQGDDTTHIGIVYSDADPWVSEPDAGFAIYVSPQMPATRLSYKGPYKLIGNIRGNDLGPPFPASPAQFPLGYETTPGFHIFTKINFYAANYARQGPFTSRITIIP